MELPRTIPDTFKRFVFALLLRLLFLGTHTLFSISTAPFLYTERPTAIPCYSNGLSFEGKGVKETRKKTCKQTKNRSLIWSLRAFYARHARWGNSAHAIILFGSCVLFSTTLCRSRGSKPSPVNVVACVFVTYELQSKLKRTQCRDNNNNKNIKQRGREINSSPCWNFHIGESPLRDPSLWSFFVLRTSVFFSLLFVSATIQTWSRWRPQVIERGTKPAGRGRKLHFSEGL